MKTIYLKLRLTIILTVLAGMSISTVYAQFAGGSGTETDPYQVATTEHLDNVRDYPDAFFIQTADIDLGVAPYNVGEGWVPIGFFAGTDSVQYAFRGTYDGDNYLISNLTINRPSESGQGLFGYTLLNDLLNVRLVSVNVHGYDYVAGLVGYSGSNTNIDHCNVQGIITGQHDYIGGLVGISWSNWHITNCFTSVQVSGNSYVGGLAGFVTVSSDISTCYATGNVVGATNLVGGLIGWLDVSRISNCYSRANVDGDAMVGGLTGRTDSAEIIRCYSTGEVIMHSMIGGGMIGYNHDNQTFDFCYWDMQTSGWDTSQGGVGRNTDEMTYPNDIDTYIGWSFPGIWSIDTPVSINDGYPYLTNNHITAIEEDNQVVSSPELSNYPNPFSLNTKILYQIKATTRVEIDIYNLKGERLYGLVNGVSEPGSHTVFWNGKTDNGNVLPSGVYLCRLTANSKQVCKKLILMK